MGALAINDVMTDTAPDDMAATPPISDVGMTPAEAAARLGISERTVQRRLKQGALQGYKVDTGRGEVWRVVLDGMTDTPPVHRDVMAAMPTMATHQGDVTPPDVAEFAHAVIDDLRQEYRDELERLRRDNQQLAGQLGFLQSEIQQRDRTIALLTAPKEDEPADVTPRTEPEMPAVPDPKHRPWWKRLFG
jgi:excisionase family DNA binding protein